MALPARTSALILALLVGATATVRAQEAGDEELEQAAAPEASPDEAATLDAAPEGTLDEEEYAESGPVPIQVGIRVVSFSKLDLGFGTHDATVLLSFLWEAEAFPHYTPSLDFVNGRDVRIEVLREVPGDVVLRASGQFVDQFDMSRYPFNEHQLTIWLRERSFGADALNFEIDAAETGLSPGSRLPGWDLLAPEAKAFLQLLPGDRPEQAYPSARIEVPIRRVRMAGFLTFLLPVAFMVFIVSVGIALRPQSAGARLSLGTAILLTAMMFHLSVTASLPPLGYVTLADKVMLGTYLVLVAHILCSVLMMRNAEAQQEAQAMSLYRGSLIGLPVFTVLVFLAVFTGLV